MTARRTDADRAEGRPPETEDEAPTIMARPISPILDEPTLIRRPRSRPLGEEPTLIRRPSRPPGSRVPDDAEDTIPLPPEQRAGRKVHPDVDPALLDADTVIVRPHVDGPKDGGSSDS